MSYVYYLNSHFPKKLTRKYRMHYLLSIYLHKTHVCNIYASWNIFLKWIVWNIGSQRDGGHPSHDMYESSNRGQSRGGPPSNRGPPSRGPPPRGVPSRGPPPRDDRDRGAYSTGQRRPSNMDSRGGGPPMKRARPSSMSSRGSMRR